MMNTQAFIMPAMIFFLASRLHWSSAFILYWLSFNVHQHGGAFLGHAHALAHPEAAGKKRRLRWPAIRMTARIATSTLVVVKGSKCEACGAKVRKLPAVGERRPAQCKMRPAPARWRGDEGPSDRGQKKQS